MEKLDIELKGKNLTQGDSFVYPAGQNVETEDG